MLAGAGISFSKILYRPIFDRLGVWAKLSLATGDFDIIALDKTVGVALPQAGGTVVETLTPMAELMMADVLALGITLADFNDDHDSTITLFSPGADRSSLANGKKWHIISHKLNPSSMGIADGTVYLQLEGDTDD